MSHANDRLEKLRLYYKPSRTFLLLVGESPPPRRGFFYNADSPEGQLSRITRRVFEDVSGVEFADRRDFLNNFKRKGCYLYDLPNKRKDNTQSKLNRTRGSGRETEQPYPTRETPDYRIGLDENQQARRKGDRESSDYCRLQTLPYPTRNYVTQYRSGLAAILTPFFEAQSRADQRQSRQ